MTPTTVILNLVGFGEKMSETADMLNMLNFLGGVLELMGKIAL